MSRSLLNRLKKVEDTALCATVEPELTLILTRSDGVKEECRLIGGNKGKLAVPVVSPEEWNRRAGIKP
ncbi:MAG: hypothetical protein PHN92_08190 [Geobacter sp.]|nr:hypothetical protein [Geobacter sp.]